MKKIIYTLAVACMFFSCEDEVSLNLNDAPPVLVVDAWVNNLLQPQVITLTQSQPYFEAEIPEGVSSAEVYLQDSVSGEIFEFTEDLEVDGKYTWDPSNSSMKLEMNHTYKLYINIDGDEYESYSRMNRVPPIDSITYTFYEERNAFQPEGYYGEFVAKDYEGVGDSYWIKAYKNGKYLNRPGDLNYAYDAGFGSTGELDGLVFIQPIQSAVTPLNEDEDEYVPYVSGDSLYVEIHSISNDAYRFLEEMQVQIDKDGGFSEIFAEPLENVPTNIVNLTPETSQKAVGFFNVAAVSSKGRRLE